MYNFILELLDSLLQGLICKSVCNFVHASDTHEKTELMQPNECDYRFPTNCLLVTRLALIFRKI